MLLISSPHTGVTSSLGVVTEFMVDVVAGLNLAANVWSNSMLPLGCLVSDGGFTISFRSQH
jgi:hypothetical protein